MSFNVKSNIHILTDTVYDHTVAQYGCNHKILEIMLRMKLKTNQKQGDRKHIVQRSYTLIRNREFMIIRKLLMILKTIDKI